MTTIKKLIAALTAITSMASLGVGTISASAADLDAINEKILNDTATEEDKVIASCTDLEAQKLGLKMYGEYDCKDIELAIDQYEIGKTMSQISDMPYDYYSTSRLAETNHYIALIAIHPDEKLDEEISLAINSSFANIGNRACLGVSDYTKSAANLKIQSKIKNNVIRYEVTANPIGQLRAAAFFGEEIVPTTSCKSEAQLKCSVSLNDTFLTNKIEFETFAIGDVNHDGDVNAIDSLCMSKYLNNGETFDYIYNDGSNHYSFATNEMAADVNHDGRISLEDLNLLNHYLVGSAYIW